MRLANLSLIWLLALPVLAWFFGRMRGRARSARLEQLADRALLKTLWPGFAGEERSVFRYSVLAVGMTALLAIAALRPQWGFTMRESKRSGIDIAIAVDVSESMEAEDVSPNRLERARREISDLLDELQGDRITLVAFAGVPFVEVPLTLDYRAFKTFLPALSPDLIPVQGSHLESALEKALETLDVPKTGPAPVRRRAILLLSDGEELEGDISRVVERCKNARVKIFTIGIGSKDGAPIPTGKGYKLDREGRVVITRLQDAPLIALAEQTGGVYVSSVASNDDIRTIYRSIRAIGGDTPLTFGDTKRWNEYFQLPLAIALVLLVLLWLRAAPPERRQLPLAALLLCASLHLSATRAHAIDPEAVGAEALEQFRKGEFSEAAEGFAEGKKAAADDFRFSLGLGASHYRLGRFDLAKGAFMEAAGRAKVPKDRARALYNAGNSMVQLRELEEAIRTYEAALAIEPNDKEIQDNLAFAKKLLEEQKKREQENDKKNNEQQQSSPQPTKDPENRQSPDPKKSPSPNPSTPEPSPQPSPKESDDQQQQDQQDQSPEKSPSPPPSVKPQPSPEPGKTPPPEESAQPNRSPQPGESAEPQEGASPPPSPSPAPQPSSGAEPSPSPAPAPSTGAEQSPSPAPSTDTTSSPSPGASGGATPSPVPTGGSSQPSPAVTTAGAFGSPSASPPPDPSFNPRPGASTSPSPSADPFAGGPSGSPSPEAEAPVPPTGDPLKDLPHDPLLDSVEEKGQTLKSFRMKKAQEILGAEKRKPPEKDW